MPDDIFNFITEQERAYEMPIVVVDGWEWSMKKHIRLSTLYKNSQFSVGNDDAQRDNKPFKNIVRPILNMAYRTEGFDVKDITLYVDDSESFFKSFLVKKYHDRWASQNDIDTFLDEMVESYVDYGGALIKDVNDVKPEVVPLYSIAFCDQTNILTAPLGIKHFLSPDELQGFAKKGWGDPKNNADITIEDLIVVAGQYKVPDSQTGEQVKVSTKAITIYEVHGVLPEKYMLNGGSMDKFVRQMQIVAFYKNEKGKNVGVKLFAGKEKESIFRMIKRDPIHGRALGFGGVEELFEAQVWTNWDEIAKKGMLELASKIIFKTTDAAFKNRNKITDAENGEVFTLDAGNDVQQINTQPVNIIVFEKAVQDWNDHAQTMGGATDPMMGKNAPAGTPFALQQLTTTQAQAGHIYRQGKLSTFTVGLYRDWMLKWFAKDLAGAKKFLAELSLDELQTIAENVVTNQINDVIKGKILKGEVINPSDIDKLKVAVRTQFMKAGNKKFLEILDGEMKDVPLDVHIDIAGKQKDLAGATDKIVNIFRFAIGNPQGFIQVMKLPGMSKAFNDILEFSNLSPVDFSMGDMSNMDTPANPAPVTPPNPVPTPPTPSPVIPTPPVVAA